MRRDKFLAEGDRVVS